MSTNWPHTESLRWREQYSAMEDRFSRSISSHVWLSPASLSSPLPASSAASDGFWSRVLRLAHIARSVGVSHPQGLPLATAHAWYCVASPEVPRCARTNVDRWDSTSESVLQWTWKWGHGASPPARTPCTYPWRPEKQNLIIYPSTHTSCTCPWRPENISTNSKVF